MKIGVYGLGGFGTFWAKELSKHFDVICSSRSPKNIEGLEIVDFDNLCKNSDIIFICSTMNSLDEVVKKISENITDKAIIVDTCSVKTHPLTIMKKYLSKGQFVATHPMFGPQSGANGIKDLPIVLDDLNNDKNKKILTDIFTKMELKIVSMTCDEHDKQSAYSQALSHFVGRALSTMNLKEVEIATYADNQILNIIRHIDNNTMELFNDMHKLNPYTKKMREEILEAFNKIKEPLDEMQGDI